MSLLLFAKEWIIINEELAIYISFFIVLYILITNLGSNLNSQFSERANQIANNYSIGSNAEEKNILNKNTLKYRITNQINELLVFEKVRLFKVFKVSEYNLVNLYSIKLV